jgi:mono/diheme cytochrome c family protein
MELGWVERMGGPNLAPSDESALLEWLDAMPAPRRPAGDRAAIERGRALFESEAVGCASCHSGPLFTSGETSDVATGGAFQVPPLAGVAYRAPYLHSGCAAQLRDAFEGGACVDGEHHGHTSHLGAADVSDLEAYVRSL